MNTTHINEPTEQNGKQVVIQLGGEVLLRDYFAAKAMQALMTSDKYGGIVGINNYEHNRAKDAYKVADAMLKAREA